MINNFSTKKTVLFSLSALGLSLIGSVISLPFEAKAACASSIQEVWSEGKFIEGGGVTNCGAARIENDVYNKCQQQAKLDPQIIGVSNTSWYNASSESDRTWDGKRSCKYRATYKCQFVVKTQSL